MAYERRAYPGDAAETTLNGAITAGATALVVATGAGAGYPTAGPAFLIIDYDKSTAEKVTYTTRTADTFSGVTRGVDGTTAQSHPDGAKVRAVWTGIDADEANQAVVNTVGKITAIGDLLIGAGANTLKRLGVGAASKVLRVNTAATDLTWGDVTNVQTFTAGGTWTKPAGVNTVHVVVIGGGGGGGSGSTTASGTASSGGGGGGGGGASVMQFPASLLGATETVTVGAGGPGAVGVSGASVSGNAGTAGGNTTFGSWLVALGAFAGPGGVGNANTSTANGGAALYSGSTGGTGINGNTGGPGGASAGFTVTGGGAGGGVTAAPLAKDGGGGGSRSSTIITGSSVGGTAGGGAGAVGTSGTANEPIPGTGGGGGGSNAAGAGGAGGAGGIYGGGGGGGGACLNGSTSGAGGAGGAGICVVTSW